MPDPLAPKLPPLPSNPFDPFTPADDAPFDTKLLSHLLRRTVFGSTPDRLEKYSKLTPAEIIDQLLAYDPNDDPLNPLLDQLEGLVTPFNKPELAQEWWLLRIFKTPRPLQEKIALFWHNNFATSIGKGDNPMRMVRQTDLFRRLGLANFRDLLLAVGRDPAMLVYLDGQHSKKGKPNENYARELMELFTLGIGNYTEQDVKEVARAFTGWRIKGDEGFFDKSQFDDTEKEIFGKKGKFNDEAVVDLILDHPACPKHIARKFLREFVHPSPPQEVVDHYARRLLDLKWELKPLLREMLTSRMFFSDFACRSKIKSPVDIVVGSIQALVGMGTASGTGAGGGKPSFEAALKQLTSMGQTIMMPPNVKGWDGEESWINANTLFVRYNFASSVVQSRSREFTRTPDIKPFLEKHELTTPDKILDYFSTLLLGELPAPATREKLLAFMNTTKDKRTPFVLNANTVQSKVRQVLYLLMATPEYQLC